MAGMKIFLLLIVVVVLISSVVVSGRSMWGVKKKQTQEDLEEKLNDVLLKADKQRSKSGGSTGTAGSSSAAKATGNAKAAGKKSKDQPPPRRAERKPLGRSRASSNNDEDLFNPEKLSENILNLKLQLAKVKVFIYTAEFETSFKEHFDQEKFDEVLNLLKSTTDKNVPPEIMDFIKNLDYSDINKVRQMIEQGLTYAEEYLNQLLALFTDPNQIEIFLDQMPPELKEIVRALMSGDLSVIRKAVNLLPDVNPIVKELLNDLLDGNQENFIEKAKQLSESLLRDAGSAAAADVGAAGLGGATNGFGSGGEDFIELARKNLLSNPDAALASGIPLEALQDPKIFGEFMKNSMNALLQDDTALDQLKDFLGGASEEEEEEVIVPKAKLGKKKQRVEL